MATAFSAMYEMAWRLGALNHGAAYKSTSTGTTATLISTILTQADDAWNGGTLFISTGTAANQSREITDFVASTDTVTVSPVFSAAIASGVEFGITKNEYPRSALLVALNNALRWWGDVPFTDESTITTAGSTLEYALPSAGVADLRQVYIATNTSSPYDYQPTRYWHVDKYNGKLVFHVQPSYARKVRLIYGAPHTTLDSDDDTIDTNISMPALIEYALAQVYQWKLQAVGGDDKKWYDFYNQSHQLAEKYKKEAPLRMPARFTTLNYIPGRSRRGINVADPS